MNGKSKAYLEPLEKDLVVNQIAKKAVWTPDGNAFIAPGQVVTSAHAVIAQEVGILSQLIEAVKEDNTPQNYSSTSISSNLNDAKRVISPHSTWAQQNSQQSQPKPQSIWEQVIQRASHVYNCDPIDWEYQQVQNILGYPVVQTIRDQQGNVILNVGDLVTYRAVDQARRADVLDVLINSVYISLTPEG
ncbi:MAG: hypothetical protein HC835_09935 [Oscillatoriales cyanobacterium RM2_1_1]|nr:hypothetical protein [Oscillatoriales cyanobacterium SM2_3_0]NJO45920.1 hypothetical protein [Oscillatoriales cyanobacterium RM2_1_1]